MDINEDTVQYVRTTYGKRAAELVESGWTVDSAIAHTTGTCDRAICTGIHVDRLDLGAALGQIEDYARMAREALADESEANVRYSIEQLAGLADRARELVRTW